MVIHQVDLDSRRDVERFVQFPYRLYRDCPQWVPPLRSSAYEALDRRRHPFYAHSVAAFFLALSGDEVLGRIAVLEHRNFNRYHGTNVAFFGFFEAVDDSQVSAALFDAAFTWARRRGLDAMMGPHGLLGNEGNSILVEGFEHRPALGVPYNHPYYHRLVSEAGFEKETDFLSAHLDGSYQLPERVTEIAQRVRARRGFEVKTFGSLAELQGWIPRFLEAHRRAFAANRTYYPPTDAEVATILSVLRWVIDPRLVKLILRQGEVVGMVLGLRDVSAGLQRAGGRLWPTGWYHILTERRRTRWINLNGFGLLPEHRGVGADAVLLQALYDTVRQGNFERVYLVQVEEGNVAMVNEASRLGITWSVRHRSYRRSL